MKKRLLSLIMALCMVLSLLPIAASAAEIVDSGICGENANWTLNKNGILTISGSGSIYGYLYEASVEPLHYEGYEVSYGHSSPFQNDPLIQEIVIEEGITGIGDCAFWNCSASSVTIPKSLKYIGSDAFARCDNLTRVNISDISSWCEIYHQEKEFFDHSVYESYHSAFCTPYDLYLNGSLVSSCVIPEGVTGFEQYIFQNCLSLRSVWLPASFSVLGEGTFKGCSNLVSFQVDGNNPTFASIDGALCKRDPLKLVLVPEGIHGKYEIPSGVEVIEYGAFANNKSISEITVPNTVTKIGGQAFSGCSGLRRVNIADLKAWSSIEFSDGSSNPATITGDLYYNGSIITDLTLPKGTTKIGNYAFTCCASLRTVTIPVGVTSIGNGSFSHCGALETVTIPAGVTSIGDSAFKSCSSLTDMTFPEGVSSIGKSAFYGCSVLRTVKFPSSLSSIEEHAFWECPELGAVDISSVAGWCGITMGHGYSNPFFYAYDMYLKGALITDLVIPAGVSKIQNYVFDNCKSLVSLSIPNGLTDIGDFAFSRCSYLISATCGEDLKNIGEYAFSDCGLISFSFPDRLKAIAEGAFCGCEKLEGVTFPSRLTTVGRWAFSGCKALTDVKVKTVMCEWEDLVFQGCTSLTDILVENNAVFKCNVPSGVRIHEDVVDLDHHFQTFHVDPTCTESGYDLKTCTCGYEINKTNVTPATGHLWGGWEVTTPPTESTEGVETRTCLTCGKSETRRIQKMTPLEITTQPQSTGVVGGNTAAFTVQATGVDLRYQWQFKAPGSAWKDCSSATAGYNTSALKVVGVSGTTNRNGYQYRCVIRDAADHTVTTDAATLSVLAITAQPKNASVTGSNTAAFTVKATGSGLSYQWQYRTSASGTWHDCTSLTQGYNTTEITVAGVSNSVNRNGFQYRCVVTDGNGSTVISDPATLSVKLAAPTLTVKLNAKGQPYLTWTAVPTAAKYEIWRATSSGGTYSKLTTTTGRELTNSSAAAGTTYYYKVRAVDANGNVGAFSAVKSAKASLAAPTLTVKLNAKGQPYLTWTAVTGAAKYEVWRATSSGGTYSKLSTTTGKSLTNSSATVGTTYYYKVRAVTSGGAAGAFSAVKSAQASLSAPTLTVKLNAKGQPYLTWTAVTGAAKYEIWRATSENGTYTKLSTTTGKSLTNSSATVGTTYYYKVRALTSDGAAGSFSAVKSIRVRLAAPTLTVKLNSKGQPYLTWTAVTGAAKYEIWRATSADGTYTKLSTTTGKSLTNSSASSGVTYYYKVRAVGADGYVGVFSTVKSVTAK